MAVKPIMQQNSAVPKAFLEKIKRKLKSLILKIGLESLKLLYSCRHRLLGQTTKQPLSNFEPQTT